MASIGRVPTGLTGLDKVLQGGLPERTINLLSGACGTGKSTFAMQFLYYGAKYCDEPGVYVTLEEDPDKLVQNMSLFGWDLEGLIKKKKLAVIKPDVYKFDSIKQIIRDSIDKVGAKRLVVDSYSVLLTYFNDPYEIRNGLVQLDRELKKMNCTALIISDIKDNSEIFSTTGVEEFIVDGVLVLYLIKDPKDPLSSRRAISVRKMRATHHPLTLHPFEISERGISIDSSGWGKFRPGKGTGGQGSGPQKAASQKQRKASKKENAAKEFPSAKDSRSVIDVGALRSSGRGVHSWK